MSWITLALLMVPLIGHLQAAPLNTRPSGPLSIEAMGLRLLAELSCDKDVNFTSPTNVEDKCYDAALGHFIQEFQRAVDKCSDQDDHIQMTLEELEGKYAKTQTACTLTMTTHTTFAGFVDAMKEFAQQYNDSQFRRK